MDGAETGVVPTEASVFFVGRRLLLVVLDFLGDGVTVETDLVRLMDGDLRLSVFIESCDWRVCTMLVECPMWARRKQKQNEGENRLKQRLPTNEICRILIQ
jgi:hypothetical protein